MDIPGYRIEREIGHGGMATVYLAQQISLDRPVALKVMAPALAADRSFSERFIKEAKTVAQLNHPCIVSIYDVGVAGHHHYLALEYIEGADLKSRLRQAPLAPNQALIITRQIALALGYAHDKGFVHRDIKPENILFREDGRAVLTDFGIAKTLGSGTRMTGTGMSIGTPHYMSPEQARGQPVDTRSDLYALGIVLYEMLTGRIPYDADDTLAVIYSHVNDPIPKLPANLSHLQPLLDCLLAKQPEQRYPNASTLIQAIEQLEQGVDLSQSQLATRVMPRAQKTRISSPSADPAAPAKRNGKTVFIGSLGAALTVVLLFGGYEFLQTKGVSDAPAEAAEGTSGPQPTPEQINEPRVTSMPVPEIGLTESNKPVEALNDQTQSQTETDSPAPQAQQADDLAAQTRQERLAELAQAQEIKQLLAAASSDINALRLSSPPNNNAVEKYEKILRIDAQNSAAKSGLVAVVEKYLALTDSADQRHQYSKAENYLAKAEAILPSYAGIETKRANLLEAKRLYDQAAEEKRQRAEAAFSKAGELVAIKGGCYQMGSPSSEKGRENDEKKHQVCVKDFKIRKYEITQREWKAIMGNNPSNFKGENHPVEQVSWYDVEAFIKKLNEKTGGHYRLPTEAEWEYACRSGTGGQRYCGGDNADRLAWYTSNSGNKTKPVGEKRPNGYGLYDMSGNVWEWTCSEYESQYKGAEQRCARADSEANRSVRGGSWLSTSQWIRSAIRFKHRVSGRSAYLGFRLVQD